jgi:hypothetical protein
MNFSYAESYAETILCKYFYSWAGNCVHDSLRGIRH